MTDSYDGNVEELSKELNKPNKQKQSTESSFTKFQLTNIKNFICYNQGEYAQYNFLVSRRHQELKEVLPKGDATDIKAKLNSLNEFVFTRVDAVFTKSFEILKKYFAGRNEKLPRVCVKCHDDKKNIVDFCRDRQDYLNMPYHISANTGFNEVYRTGRAYQNNNIPKAAHDGSYKNPRLHSGAVRIYFKTLRFPTRGEDTSWRDCWNPTIEASSKNAPPLESCYKSTLIVPMTLLNNELDDEFKKHFKIEKKQADDEKPRAIWGYLCFDHPEIDYFTEGDEALGYVFADILSLYLITQLTYTEYSKTYISAKKEVEDAKAS